jgi:hypothetical protein
MKSTILIYNESSNLNKDSFFLVDDKNIIKYNKKIYLLYDAKEINPPFFDKIIIARNNLKEEEMRMIYNMTLVGGTIIFFNEQYKHFLYRNHEHANNFCRTYKGLSELSKDSKNCIHKNHLNYYQIKKNDNIVYNFPHTRIVDFIIMGTQKGGTTALAQNIGKHPDIFLNMNPDPRISEVHFFDLHWKKGIEWYKKQFDYSKKIVGDKTPDLMYLHYTFPLIQSVNPYLKIILVLRNPVERAYSAWKMIKKYWDEKRSFEVAVTQELESKLDEENKTFYTSQKQYLQRGLYYKQIKNILKWFPRNNLLVLISEKVKNNMREEYDKVYSFLNLKPFETNYELEFVSNNKSNVNKVLYNSLINFYKKDIVMLEKFLKIKTGWA